MDLSRIAKWLVILVIAFLAWKYLSPKFLKQSNSTPASAEQGGFVNSSCIGAADKASQAWGSGVGKFVNPPYDMDAWSVFRSDVDTKIANAEGQCACIAESCHKVQSAMHELSSLVSDLDGSLRGGTPPPDGIVQRQESIDRQLDEARELIRSGK
jgi:hypothetical protein